jgi:hypothetical protein
MDVQVQPYSPSASRTGRPTLLSQRCATFVALLLVVAAALA